MWKFKVGDRIRIKSKNVINEIRTSSYSPGFVADMYDYCNKEATVIRRIGNGCLRLDIDNDAYFWHEDWLEFAITEKKGEDENMRVNIKDVKIVVPNKVVEVTFGDGTKEKAVCAEEDTYSLDTAITICLVKHMLGGSNAYNNIIRRANKILIDKAKAEEKREQEIELHKEAYKRAMRELEEEKTVVNQ